MPTRGYRKGISDDKQASPRRLHTRLADDIHAALNADAIARHVSASHIIRALVTAHYTGGRLELPHASGPSSLALRELNRLGNNLNQIARQANLMQLHLLEAKALACIGEINQAARCLIG
ncbi:MAG: MobC family plasmid mobilization relaxosome protein [Alphaproteobacteria bacterium]|nr:MobC family plasmid mobilization relaxosome protein [Alphaproteobacteria bacterium]